MSRFKEDNDDISRDYLEARFKRSRRKRHTAKHVISRLKAGGVVVVEMVDGRPSARLEGDDRDLTPHVWNTIRGALVPAEDGLFRGTSQTYRHPEGAKS
jgi:hypothetical protein